MANSDSIVHLNVGGTRFSTSKQTLTWIPDSFFTSLLCGKISSLRDENGAIFIDRDPEIFKVVLNYLRTKQVDLTNINVELLTHEAQYYGLSPLVKRLMLCEELDDSLCGDVLFHGYLGPPPLPLLPEKSRCSGGLAASDDCAASTSNSRSFTNGIVNSQHSNAVSCFTRSSGCSTSFHSRNLSEPPVLPSFNRQVCNITMKCFCLFSVAPRPLPSMEAKFQIPSAAANVIYNCNDASLPIVPMFETADLCSSIGGGSNVNTFVNNSINIKQAACTAAASTSCNYPVLPPKPKGHVRTNSADFRRHNRGRGSSDLTRQIRQMLKAHNSSNNNGSVLSTQNPYRVRIIRGHHNWIAVGYSHFICCYKMKDSMGWQLTYLSRRMEAVVQHLSINAKFANQSEALLAVALADFSIHLWAVNGDGVEQTIGIFSLTVPVDTLFFIGTQLAALSKRGKLGIWHSMTQNWQVQDVCPISSYDTAGSFLLLGCTNGSIYYIDMQKFPLRMKDNDLLVTELYRDPSADVITSISVYLTPKTNLCGNWIEIAYGTSGGLVRVIVQHPETVGHGPQLFQTFTVHRESITRVALTTTHLISVCSEYNHVRSWTVTRFRGMISTQPGPTPLASFKVLALDSADQMLLDSSSDPSDVGPYGEQDGEQLFIQKIVPETNQIYVRLASTGDRVCVIRSVDNSTISSFLVHECEGSSRMGSRPRRYLFTGHTNGCIQMWDLTTAMDMYQVAKEKQIAQSSGPSANEILRLIDQCEITCGSLASTPAHLTPAQSTLQLHAAHTVVGFGGASLVNFNGVTVKPPLTVSNSLDDR